MKVCTKCGIEKDESEFGKNKPRKDGLNVWCKSCAKQYREDNKETLKIKRLDYYSKNKKKLSENKKNRRKQNIDEYRLKDRDRHSQNKERRNFLSRERYRNDRDNLIQKRKERRLNNIENYREKDRQRWLIAERREWSKEYRSKHDKQKLKNNPAFALKARARRRFSHGLNLNAIKKIKPFFEYTNISYADYISYFENNFPVEFSQITEKGKYHIDHIIPCAVYDFNNPEEIKKCWQPENLRIIPASENLSKGDTLDYDLIEKHNIWHLLPEKYRIKTA